MRILHVSDTHGHFRQPLSGDVDVVVHSGDFLPNKSRGNRPVEEVFQSAWVRGHADGIRRWLGGRKLLVCSGNHDFVDVAEELQAVGVDATCLDDRIVDVDGVAFYGFPWVPTFTGEWNFEASEEGLSAALAPFDELTNQGAVDIFVSHGPMHGILDCNLYGKRCGSRSLRWSLLAARHLPKAMLHGHIHESVGTVMWSGMLISNAAQTSRVVEV